MRPTLSAVPLLPAQRRERILAFLQRHGAVTLQQLAQALEVSPSTLRRDLDALEAEGVVDRTHGGALLRKQQYSTFEPEPAAAAELSPREKQTIGVSAAADLRPGQSVIFDSGSTVMAAARAVLERRIPLVGITNDLAIAQCLGASPHVRVHVLGGQLRQGSHTLVGPQVIEAARAFRADVLLLGAHAVTDGVLSETDADVAAVKRAWLSAAHHKRLLVDSSKFRPRALVQVCDVQSVHEIVTDSGVRAETAAQLREAGAIVKIVAAGA